MHTVLLFVLFWLLLPSIVGYTWWRHQMETFSALLAICVGNSPVTGEFPAQRPVTRSFDVFFDLHLNKRLSKQWWGWWFETPSLPLWRHCNDITNLPVSWPSYDYLTASELNLTNMGNKILPNLNKTQQSDKRVFNSWDALNTSGVLLKSSARPTNGISSELEIQPNFGVFWFEMYSSDHSDNLHTSRHRL